MGCRGTEGNMVKGCLVKANQTLKKSVFSPCGKKKNNLKNFCFYLVWSSLKFKWISRGPQFSTWVLAPLPSPQSQRTFGAELPRASCQHGAWALHRVAQERVQHLPLPLLWSRSCRAEGGASPWLSFLIFPCFHQQCGEAVRPQEHRQALNWYMAAAFLLH